MAPARNYNGKLLLFDTLKLHLFLAFTMLLITCSKEQLEYAHLVDPFIGTGGHGHTYPGASAPFGMVQLSPDTRVYGWDACSGYHYSDSTILGFSHTHLSGTGAADYGDILLTPGYSPSTPKIGFDHKDEEAWAGYYHVSTKNDIDISLTTTTRVGIHNVYFKKNDQRFVAIDLEHGIGPDKRVESDWEQTSDNEISGYRRSSGWAEDQVVFFVARFSENFSINSTSIDSVKAILEFQANFDNLIIKVGISAVSVEGARSNLESEANHWNFSKYVEESTNIWNRRLEQITTKFNSGEDQSIFYTALYHSLLAPNIFNDQNGEYRGMDQQIHNTELNHYTVYSLWDTFRATHPLFTILNPKADAEMINSMLKMRSEGGLLPVWELAGNETGTMIGYHSIPVITDAIMKNIPGFDYQEALEAMIHSANQNHLGLSYYKEMGYIPAEKEHESVSKTLEYAYDDWCIAIAANKLGNDSIYQEFSRRAQNYKNLYDKESGFMRPKRNGNWLVEFDPYEVSGNYTEANAWQYNYFVPHDLIGLEQLFAPSATLEDRLDELFNADSKITGRHQPDIDGMIGQYAHGNEPSHNFAYLYTWTDSPWKTQELVNQINEELYSINPNGLSGNEDCGQMSSWFVFSALGFYPAVPGSNQYILGSPLVNEAQIDLENGNTFAIKATNNNEQNNFIQAIKLNNHELNRLYITHEEIIAGGELEFIMGEEPNRRNGLEKPQSEITTQEIALSPLIEGGEMTFLKSKEISLSSPDSRAHIFYSLDGSAPDSLSKRYVKPFSIDSTLNVRAISYEKGKLKSGVNTASFVKIPFGRNIELKHPYSHLYTGNSSKALIDYIKGGNNFRDGWQGFHEVDLEAVIDLGKSRTIMEVKVGFLRDHYSWIFYPEYLEVAFSNDGTNFSSPVRVNNSIVDKEDGLKTQNLSLMIKNKRARFVRVYAKNQGKCPEWHKGAGDKAWLFVDEIEIKTN